MPDGRRKNCRNCKRHESDVGAISWAGYCFPCGVAIKEANARQLAAHTGPAFVRWRRACIASFGAVPIEDVKA